MRLQVGQEVRADEVVGVRQLPGEAVAGEHGPSRGEELAVRRGQHQILRKVRPQPDRPDIILRIVEKKVRFDELVKSSRRLIIIEKR